MRLFISMPIVISEESNVASSSFCSGAVQGRAERLECMAEEIASYVIDNNFLWALHIYPTRVYGLFCVRSVPPPTPSTLQKDINMLFVSEWTHSYLSFSFPRIDSI